MAVLIDKNLIIKSKNLLFRPVRLTDVTVKYVEWLNDPEVNCFLETRFQSQTIETITEYVAQFQSGPQDTLFLAIIEQRSNSHIGNIKLGPINPWHHFADIALFIGEKTAWGKGYATEAIQMLVQFAFQRLNLHRLDAFIDAPNFGSRKAFKKAGFQKEGVFRQRRLHSDGFVDEVVYSIINDKWIPEKSLLQC